MYKKLKFNLQKNLKKILKKFKLSKYELIILILILSLNFFVRFWNLGGYLIKSHELSAFIQFKKPITFNMFKVRVNTFFPAILLLKSFFFIDTFMEVRFFFAFISGLATIFIFFVLRLILSEKNKMLALLGVFIVSIDGNIVFNSHLSNTLTIFLTSILIYLLFKYLKTKKANLLFLIFILSGIALNNQILIIFFLLPLFFYIFYWSIKNKINYKKFLFPSLIFLLLLFPYILLPFQSNIKKIETEIENLIKMRNLEGGLKFEKNITINLFRPHHFLMGFGNSYSFLFSPQLLILFSFLFITIPIILYFVVRKKDYYLKSLFYIFIGMIFLYILSPVHILSRYFLTFSLVNVCFFVKLLDSNSKKIKIIILTFILVFIFSNFLTVIEILNVNQVEEAKQIENFLKNVEVPELIIDNNAYKILNFSSFSFPVVKLHVFKWKFSEGQYVFPTLSNISFSEGTILILHEEFFEQVLPIFNSTKKQLYNGVIKVYALN